MELTNNQLLELAALREDNNRLRLMLVQPWMAEIQAELSKASYKAAVDAKDAVAVFEMLTTEQIRKVKNIPAVRLKVMLLPMYKKLMKITDEGKRTEWMMLLDTVTEFETVTLADPLTVGLFNKAVEDGLLTKDEIPNFHHMPLSPLVEMGCEKYVTSPGHIKLAMGW